MKLKLLNQLKYRIIFSLIISSAYHLVRGLWGGEYEFVLTTILITTGLVFIAVTIIWVIVSTFFMNEKDDQ